MNWDVFLPVFIITLRNLFPIALLLGIVFASFQRINHPQYYRQIYLGISAGIVASFLVGSFFSQGLNNVNSSDYSAWIFTPLIINISTFITIALLIWFIFWLSQQGYFWQKLGSTNDILMGKYSRQLIFSLALFLVLIRGVEIVLLLNVQYNDHIFSSSLGAIASFLFVGIIGVAFVYLQMQLNDDLFFKILGIFLIFLSGGLMVNTIYNLEANITFINELSKANNWCLFSQDSCLLGSLLWENNSFFVDKAFPFIVLKILLGYHDHIYLIPLIFYLLFVIVTGKMYLQNLKNSS